MSVDLEMPVLDTAAPNMRWIDRCSRAAIYRQLAAIRDGSITLVDGRERRSFGGPQGDDSLSATVWVHDSRFYGNVACGGTIGAGEAFMQGYWTCDDLPTLVRVLLRNRQVIDGLDGWASRLQRQTAHWLHAWRQNSRRGSRQNIAAHYDLGNEFFRLFLDETMMYSCGIFEHADSTLGEASAAKNDRICRKLQLRPSDHLLEIGTGWGGFAIHAAGQYGCRVTTTTISQEQYTLARERVEQQGLGDRVRVLCQDYRDLTGQFDKVVSIEMIEAVGERYFDQFFGACSRLLKPDGLMLLQAITIADQQYATYRRGVDFIQRYIFPGGFLPSLGAIQQSVARVTDLLPCHLEDLAPHYARTIAAWRDRFNANRAAICDLGYPQVFMRMWEFYFGYCEGAFRERSTGCIQLVLAKPRCRREPILAALPAQ